MQTQDPEIEKDLPFLAKHMERVAEGVRNRQSLPLWAQAAHSMLTYNPESVLYQIGLWRARLEDCPDEIERVCVVLVAAHRIHRFGAGPALGAEPMAMLKGKIATLDHPEDLAEGVETGALEPRYFPHAGHPRGSWPIVLLPDAFYA